MVVLLVDALAIEGRFDWIGVRGWLFVVGSVGLAAIYGARIDRDQRRGKRQLAKASIGRFFAYAVFFFATAFLLNQWAIIAGIYADGLDSAGGALVSALQSAAMSVPFFLISWLAFHTDRRTEEESQRQSERDRVLRERLLAEMRSAPDCIASYPFRARNELGKDGGRTDEILKEIATCVSVSDGRYQLKAEFRTPDDSASAQAECDARSDQRTS
ncbi:MAG: hypothetical protein U0836_11660 [Pirellulales bacterium]